MTLLQNCPIVVFSGTLHRNFVIDGGRISNVLMCACISAGRAQHTCKTWDSCMVDVCKSTLIQNWKHARSEAKTWKQTRCPSKIPPPILFAFLWESQPQNFTSSCKDISSKKKIGYKHLLDKQHFHFLKKIIDLAYCSFAPVSLPGIYFLFFDTSLDAFLYMFR